MPEAQPVPAPDPLIACTAATSADLPAAAVAAGSFLRDHPSARFVTLVVDGRAGDGVLTPADIGVGPDELAQLTTGYTAEQACAVLRPRLLQHLLSGHPGAVLYLDPAVRVYAPVGELLAAATKDASLVLVPRALRPQPDDGLRPTQEDLLAAGVYDAGFVAVAQGAEHFLDAWAEGSRRDPARAGAFLDGAPALVDHHVLRDAGLGLSVWNAGQRPLAQDTDRRLTAGGSLVRTVNLAGFDPGSPWLLHAAIADRPRVLLSAHPLLNRVCVDYAAELDQEGPPPAPALLYGALADGTRLPATLQAQYRSAGADRPPPIAVDPGAFLRWTCDPTGDAAGGTRWSAALWADDPELRERFPDPVDVDAGAYRDWCATDAVLAGRLHPHAIPGRGQADVTLVDQIGVSVLGSGPLAERVRMAAAASGLPTSDQPVYPVVLCCGPVAGVPMQRRVVAVHEEFAAPPGWADERWLVWPATPAGHDGLVTHTIPLPVTDPGARDEIAVQDARQAFAVEDQVVLVAVADPADDLLAAFAAAFPDRTDVRLLLLMPRMAGRASTAERLRLAAAADPRVRLVEDESRFAAAADAAHWAVSLDEPGAPADPWLIGWLTRVSLRGVPLVGILGGAASDMLGTDCCVALPVDQFAVDTMVAGALRDLADDAATADKLGTAARGHLLDSISLNLTGGALRRRVELAYRSWRAGRALAGATENDPLQALRAARHVLHRRPDVDVGYRIPMAPALRRAVLRVLNHYDAHLHTVLGTLIDGIERTATELVERQEKLTGAGPGPDLDLVRADLDLVVDRNAQLARQLAASGEDVVRLRGEVAGTTRSVDTLSALVRETAVRGSGQESDAARRIDELTAALAATAARMSTLEERLTERDHARDSRTATDSWSVNQALHTTDALRRVIVRQHERATAESGELADVPSSVVLCDAGLLRLPADDAVMSAVLSSNGEWEPEIAELVDSLVEPESVFVDIGAYVGYHALRVLSRLGTSGTVVAVEPAPEAVKLLRHNVSANVSEAVAQRLVVLEAAAWDSQSPLVGAPAAGGGVGVGPTPADHDPQNMTQDTQNRFAFPGVRLDRELGALEATKNQRLSVVKVDVPGRGHRALGGLVRRLRKDRPHVICAFEGPLISGFGDDPGIALREFRTWGYEVVRLGETAPAPAAELLSGVLSGEVRTLWLKPAASR